ncbi:hypothetical protein J2810_004593 [Chryseobacterium rhizosphaerae]|nr:hypothetical protein [Chryseobacterium rhizosphaerae]
MFVAFFMLQKEIYQKKLYYIYNRLFIYLLMKKLQASLNIIIQTLVFKYFEGFLF